jgi:hypothetical protein
MSGIFLHCAVGTQTSLARGKGTCHDDCCTAMQRRHDWLLSAIAQRIGPVPKDGFFPLGRRSRALLRPGAARSSCTTSL